MSITRVKPGRGIWVKCDGTDNTVCSEKRYTGNIVPKHNRAHWATKEGWGRGLRSHTKRWDLCPTHLEMERVAKAQQDADKAAAKEAKKLKIAQQSKRREERAAKKAEREAAKAAKLAAASDSTSSPSADSAPAPAS